MSELEIPLGDEQLAGTEPEEGDSVMVKEPKPDEIWSHAFYGIIYSLPMHDADTYVIEDQDGNTWEMERDRFYLHGEEDQ